MSLELDNDGPFAPRDSARTRALRTQASGREEAWPLLARLPRIDAAHRSSEPLPLFTPPEPLDDRDLLALIDLPDEAPPRARQQYADAGDATEPPVLSHEARRAGVGAGSHAGRRADAAASPAARHYRVDQASLHRAASRMPVERKPPTFAGSLFQMHASLAPHMGLIGAVGLVASATLLYWLAIGRHGTPVAVPTPRGEAAWTTEVATDAEPPMILTQPDQTATTAPQFASDWSVPRIATATPTPMAAPPIGGPIMSDEGLPPTADPPATPALGAPAPESRLPAQGATDAAAAPAGLEPAAVPPAPLGPSLAPPQDAAARTSAPSEFAAQSSVAPQQEITPTAQQEGFPTTSYPPFTFVDRVPDQRISQQFPQQLEQQYGAGAPSQPSVAERTTTAPALQ